MAVVNPKYDPNASSAPPDISTDYFELDGDGNILLGANPTPLTPAAGKITINNQQRAKFSLLSLVDEFGQTRQLQSSNLFVEAFEWTCQGSGQAMVGNNIAFATSNTATIQFGYAGNYQDHYLSKGRILLQTPNLSGLAYAFSQPKFNFSSIPDNPPSNNLGGFTGFLLAFRFNREDFGTFVTDTRVFIGLSTSLTPPTNVQPSTLLNSVGIIKDSADTTYSLYSAGSAIGTKIDLGANFNAASINDSFEVIFFSPINSGKVYYEVRRVNTGYTHVTSGEFSSANLPASWVQMGVRAWINSATALVQARLAIHYFYGEVPR